MVRQTKVKFFAERRWEAGNLGGHGGKTFIIQCRRRSGIARTRGKLDGLRRRSKEIEFFFDLGDGFGGEAGFFLGEKFVADVGALKPLAEFLFFARLDIGLVQDEAVAGNLDPGAGEFAAAQAAPILNEGAQALPAAVGVGGGELGLDGGEVVAGEPIGAEAGEGAVGGFAGLGFLGNDLAEQGLEVFGLGVHGFLILVSHKKGKGVR